MKINISSRSMSVMMTWIMMTRQGTTTAFLTQPQLSISATTADATFPVRGIVYEMSPSNTTNNPDNNDASIIQERLDDTTEAFMKSDIDADAFVEGIEAQLESLENLGGATSKQESSSSSSSSVLSNVKTKLPDFSTALEKIPKSISKEQVDQVMNTASKGAKAFVDFSKVALEQAQDMAATAKAKMGTTTLGKDKSTTYADAFAKIQKSGQGVWKLLQEAGSFVGEKAKSVDYQALQDQASKTMDTIKSKASTMKKPSLSTPSMKVVKDDTDNDMPEDDTSKGTSLPSFFLKK